MRRLGRKRPLGTRPTNKPKNNRFEKITISNSSRRQSLYAMSISTKIIEEKSCENELVRAERAEHFTFELSAT